MIAKLLELGNGLIELNIELPHLLRKLLLPLFKHLLHKVEPALF